MKQYKQLTSGLRYQIYGLKQTGLNQTGIAKKIGVDKGTISREFKRNEGKRGWRPKQARLFRDEHRQADTNGKCFSLDEWAEVERLIQENLSPEQAANRLELEGVLKISHQTILMSAQRLLLKRRAGQWNGMDSSNSTASQCARLEIQPIFNINQKTYL